MTQELMQIEYVQLQDLKMYRNNTRTHSDKQVKQIERSIKKFKFRNPLLIDDKNIIVAGHGRYMAAKNLDMSEVPCIRCTDWTDAQKRAYIMADNKLALNAGWDIDLLKVEIERLQDEDFEISVIGFNEKELAEILEIEDVDLEPKEDDYNSVFNIIVNCDDEMHQENVFNKLSEMGLKCQVQSL